MKHETMGKIIYPNYLLLKIMKIFEVVRNNDITEIVHMISWALCSTYYVAILKYYNNNQYLYFKKEAYSIPLYHPSQALASRRRPETLQKVS